VLANPVGTAPGVWMRIGGAWVAAMPGVPSEMHAMYEQQVKPRVLALGMGGGVLVQRKINCFGAGESAVEEKVADLTRRGHVPEVGITVGDGTISLRIWSRQPTLAEAMVEIEPVERTARERLGELVFGVDDEDLQHAVVGLLAEKRKTLATAEGVTAGLVAQRLGLVPGAAAWFRGGVVAYDNRLKTDLLGVPEELIAAHGAVSAAVAEAMAAGCRARLGVDLAVSTVGVAGPDGGTADKPAGTVFAAVAWDGGAQSIPFCWPGTRAEVQSRTAKMALNAVRLRLMKE
jgi:PncC family amidohydrolase